MVNITLIAAMDNNGLIGVNNDLPWRISEDLKRFKQLTTGHTIIMGRKTYESLPGALPNRRNIVITSDREYKRPGIDVVPSIEYAIRLADKTEENFVVGGASIYDQFLPFANKMYLTRIKAVFSGDAYFPKVNFENWEQTEREEHVTTDEKRIKYFFETYIRKG